MVDEAKKYINFFGNVTLDFIFIFYWHHLFNLSGFIKLMKDFIELISNCIKFNGFNHFVEKKLALKQLIISG